MKQFIIPFVFIIGPFLSISCNDKDDAKEKQWSYEGETSPGHWAEIGNNDCDGLYQSPVDILTTTIDNALPPLDIQYGNETLINNVTNNGHTIQFNFAPGDYMVYNGEEYLLKQIHFHESSEHTIEGVRFPIELHLVHQNDQGQYAVISLLAKESEFNAEPFQFLESYLPLGVNEIKTVGEPFNLNNFLPENRQYYTYTGSLTTPPCTEGVQWFIFKTSIAVSLEFINQLHDLMPLNNYRDVQPLNGRVILESQ